MGIKMVSRELTKQQIRSKILLKLKTQEDKKRRLKSRVIKDRLFRMRVFKKAKRVMFYVAFKGEVETREMIREALKLGKIILVPVCKKNRIIKACLWDDQRKLTRGPYGVWEPRMKKSINLKSLDLVVVPGVAFDKKGMRLGRGKGYYDRFLKKLSPKTASIGLAFNFQILPQVPAAPFDVKLNQVVFA